MILKRFLVLITLCLIQTVPVADTLVLGVHPYLPALELQKRFSPLVEHLSSTLDHKVKLKISPSYEEHLHRVITGEVDIAYLGPASFVKVYQQQPQLETLARLEVNGAPFFQGKIVARHDAGINKLEQLKGKRFAFGNKNSTMSHVVPRHLLQQQGVFDELDEYSFLGGHNDVALGVLIGKYDAGAVKEGVFHKYKDKGLVLIDETTPISEHLFVASHKVPEKLCLDIRQSLLMISSKTNGIKILKSIKPSVTNLVSVNPDDYNNLHSIMQAVPNWE